MSARDSEPLDHDTVDVAKQRNVENNRHPPENVHGGPADAAIRRMANQPARHPAQGILHRARQHALNSNKKYRPNDRPGDKKTDLFDARDDTLGAEQPVTMIDFGNDDHIVEGELPPEVAAHIARESEHIAQEELLWYAQHIAFTAATVGEKFRKYMDERAADLKKSPLDELPEALNFALGEAMDFLLGQIPHSKLALQFLKTLPLGRSQEINVNKVGQDIIVSMHDGARNALEKLRGTMNDQKVADAVHRAYQSVPAMADSASTAQRKAVRHALGLPLTEESFAENQERALRAMRTALDRYILIAQCRAGTAGNTAACVTGLPDDYEKLDGLAHKRCEEGIPLPTDGPCNKN